ncbi:hemoglobin [Nitrosomonas ureae]|uniref:Hemoglobin n=2 Tax=Nitrosomonas ureae TaxID=44577 RepID=A0A1H9F7Z3_9PROT|nr:hemoglobin [Nitrosomonas ureae]SEQ34076.1 hemoglobin [Nitrosomonas ureae]
MVAIMKTLVILTVLFSSACVNQMSSVSVYKELGGYPKIEQIVDNFIIEIEKDPVIFEYFKESDVERFRTKLTEHICFHTGGPCKYTGDTMERVHDGMNITETDFNRGVDLLINAMYQADIPHRIQNKMLAIFVPMREQMIYRP